MTYRINNTAFTGNSININFNLISKINNLGLYSTIEDTKNFLNLVKISEFYNPNWISSTTLYDITGVTSDKLYDIKSYNGNFTIGVNGDKEITGVSANEVKYTFKGDNPNQNINYLTNLVDFNTTYKITSFGLSLIFNVTQTDEGNAILEGIVMEEKNIGLSEKPKIKDNVNIDRGKRNAFKNHFLMRNVNTLEDLF